MGQPSGRALRPGRVQRHRSPSRHGHDRQGRAQRNSLPRPGPPGYRSVAVSGFGGTHHRPFG